MSIFFREGRMLIKELLADKSRLIQDLAEARKTLHAAERLIQAKNERIAELEAQIEKMKRRPGAPQIDPLFSTLPPAMAAQVDWARLGIEPPEK